MRGAFAGEHGIGSRSRDEPGPAAAPRSAVAVGLVLADSSVVVARAARDLPRARRLGDRRRLGPGRVQPRARAGGAAGRASAARRLGPAPGRARGTRPLRRGSASSAASPARSRLLLAARCVQAIGGAARRLRLARAAAVGGRVGAPRGDHLGRRPARSAPRSGPAIGGLLTELISWQSIFFVQVPVALACAALLVADRALRALARRRGRRARARRAPASGRERRAGAGLGRARRGAVPDRPVADRGLAPDPDRGRRGGHRDADLLRSPPVAAGAPRRGRRPRGRRPA